MDTMLHELVHNVYGEHDKSFYALLEEVKAEWKMITAEGYKGEGFFSPGQRLGSGHLFYKPKTVMAESDRRRIKEVVQRGETGAGKVLEGRRLGDERGHRLGGSDLAMDLTPGE